MSRKIKEVEGQKSLDKFLKAVIKHTPSQQKSNRLAEKTKKRTPPSAEKEPLMKKLNLEEKDTGGSSDSEVAHQQGKEDIKMEVDKEKDQKNNEYKEEEEEDELPWKTILCMKRAMQELITPLEEKINLLLDTKEKQEVQEEEISKLKVRQSELYRRCLKAETENNKLKERIEKLESTMLESNLIMHGLREDEWELEEDRRECIYHAIASTINADDRHARIDIARSIPIRSTKCLGKYKSGKNRPISIAGQF